jgi:hypothetical protein
VIESLLTIAAALLPLLLEIADDWRKKRRKPERLYAQAKQQMDRALATRDADRVSGMFDELRQESGASDSGGPDGAPAGQR